MIGQAHSYFKPALLFAIVGVEVIASLTGFMPSWELFAFLYFLIFVFAHVGYVAACVHSVEILGPKWRHLSIAREYYFTVSNYTV